MEQEHVERKSREISRYSFPYYDLEKSIQVAKELHDRAGGKASMIQIASYLGHKDEFSGAFRAKIWGAQLFGLVNIEGNNVANTPLGEQLATATPSVQRDHRLAEAFLNAPLFREVYRRYENMKLPSTRDGLKKALQDKFGVPSSIVSQALKSLENSAWQAGFKRQDPNRLIHPVPIGLVEKDILARVQTSGQDEEETKVAVGSKVNHDAEVTKGVPPAIIGFLQELPSRELRWSDGERQRWLDAFEAMIKALYPAKEEE